MSLKSCEAELLALAQIWRELSEKDFAKSKDREEEDGRREFLAGRASAWWSAATDLETWIKS